MQADEREMKKSTPKLFFSFSNFLDRSASEEIPRNGRLRFCRKIPKKWIEFDPSSISPSAITLINCKSIPSSPFPLSSVSHWKFLSKCDYENLLIIYGLSLSCTLGTVKLHAPNQFSLAVTCCIHSCMCSECISIQRLTIFFPFWLLCLYKIFHGYPEKLWNGHWETCTHKHTLRRPAWM